MYYKIEVIDNLNIDCCHHHHAPLVACYACWSFLAARKSENLENPDFDHLKHLQHLGHLLLIATCMCLFYTVQIALDENGWKFLILGVRVVNEME